MKALIGADVVVASGVLHDHAVLICSGSIHSVVPAADVPFDAVVEDLGGGILVPGFIDVQVNGGGGVLFNDSPTVGGIAAIGRAHRRFGTTGFLPTLISDSFEVMDRAMRAVEAAIEAGVPGVLGIHLEGPFLYPARCGVHDPGKFRVLDEDGFSLLTSLCRGVTLVTLAPEAAPPGMIHRLVEAGVVVSLGHTDASYEQARAALAEGATGFTHLFNAMSPLGSRAPGVVGAALESDAYCGIIADGHHVDPVVLRLALRMRDAGRFMLVSDAMPSVGAVAKDFVLQGKTISVRDGICRDESGTLAGSDLDMASAVMNGVGLLGLSLPQAVAMASASSAAFLGLGDHRGRLVAGQAADLVLLDDGYQVRNTWINGASDSVSP